MLNQNNRNLFNTQNETKCHNCVLKEIEKLNTTLL